MTKAFSVLSTLYELGKGEDVEVNGKGMGKNMDEDSKGRWILQKPSCWSGLLCATLGSVLDEPQPMS